MSADDAEYFLLPLEGSRVLAVPTQGGGEQSTDLQMLGEDVARALGPLISTALRKSGTKGAKVFEMSPDSERLLATARKSEVGSYFRGVLRNDRGHASHQVQLREVTPVTGPSPFEQIAAAQLAAIQAQLERIEEILNSVVLNTTRIVQHIEGQQRARILTALKLIAEIHERTARTGALATTDWGRLTGTIEFELEAQLTAVSDELDRRLAGGDFKSNPKHSVKVMDELDPKRVSELVELHRVLVGGLRRYTELLLVRKLDANEFDEREALDAQGRLQALYERHARVLVRLEEIATAARKAKPRSNLERLMKDGIVNGSRNDSKDLAGIKAGRTSIEASVAQSRKPKAIEGSATATSAELSS